MPPSMFRSVVLPAPEGPTTTTSSPRSMSNVIPSTAATSTSPIVYTLRTSRNSTNAKSIPLFTLAAAFAPPYTNHPVRAREHTNSPCAPALPQYEKRPADAGRSKASDGSIA